LPGVIIFVELFIHLPLTERFRRMLKDLQKSMSVIRSRNISEHWKEKVLPRYSWRVMSSSIQIILFLILMFSAFLVTYGFFGLIFIGDFNKVVLSIKSLEMQIITIVLGMLYASIRTKFQTSKDETKFNYSVPSRVLHHMVLNNVFFKEMVFDIDCMASGVNRTHPKVTYPVYVAGLARSGTTILLEALYSTGQFITLTYRDMPFITAPYLWNKITKKVGIVSEEKKERAHGDNIYVNYDSPEAFEEVFWITFQKGSYVHEDQLAKHEAEKEVVENYRKYVQNILARDAGVGGARYLAKNNNNVLRINTIKSAFQDAIFIVPFRNPLNHAKSLQVQHLRFLKIHAEDPFSQKYMNWLGHFEFGANFKPFNFSQEALLQSREEPTTLEYWIRYWKSVYEYLIDRHESDVIFFDYDKLCAQPKQCLSKLELELVLPEGSLTVFSESILPSKKHLTESKEIPLSTEVNTVYNKLKDLCMI